MTTDPDAQPSRFRSARAIAPSTPQEQLRALLGDGEQLWTLLEELVGEAARRGDADAMLEFAQIAADAADPHRAYAAQRLVASVLVSSANAGRDPDPAVWARPFDRAVELLVPVLERNPHEPELLDLLGAAVFALGHTTLARRLFETVREMDPTHEAARLHLRTCREQLALPQQPQPVADAHAPALARTRTHVKGIAERARRIEDRTISLCMIVKDEEEMLPGCLEAAAPWVDEIIVVDTGSSDRTVEIAESFGATVRTFEWNGSFSDARNETLRHATSDWILWLDADEYLVDGDGPQLRELARRTWVEGFHVVETHFMGSGDLGREAQHAPMRLFQRRPEHVWHGTVHEQVAWALPNWLPGRVQFSSVRIDHYGYLAAVVSDRAKHDRNLELLMTQLEDARSAFTCFNIATEHAAMNDWPQAQRWFQEALGLLQAQPQWQEQPYAPSLVQRATAARRATGDLFGALALADEGLAAWPEYTDLVFERALCHETTGSWDKVASEARTALAMGDAPARFVSVSGKGSFQARLLLATALRKQGQPAAARRELERTIDEAPRFLEATLALTDLLLAEGEPPTQVATLIDAKLGERASSPATSLLIGSIFHEAGALEQAEERYARVLGPNPGHAATSAALAELRMLQGRLQDAWEAGIAADPLDPMAGAAARSSFLAAAAIGDPALLAEPFERLDAATHVSTSERAVYGAWRRLLDPEAARDGVHSLVPQDERAVQVVFSNLEALIKLEATDAFERAFPLAALVLPDERSRRMRFAELYLRMRFADMAGEELIACAERFGPDASILTGLGKVATIKELWEDAEIFLSESLQLDPTQVEVRRLLAAVRERVAG